MGKVTGNLSELCGLGFDAAGGFRCSMTERGARIEGVKGILQFTPERILLKLSRCRAEIEGSELCICELSHGYIVLCGQVAAVRVL